MMGLGGVVVMRGALARPRVAADVAHLRVLHLAFLYAGTLLGRLQGIHLLLLREKSRLACARMPSDEVSGVCMPAVQPASRARAR